MYTEIFTLVQEIYLGVLIDTLGRKLPLVLAYLMIGVCFILIPVFKDLYPQFLILRALIGFGTMVGMNMPLTPDYVQRKSMGLAQAYIQTTIGLGFLFSSSGMYTLARIVDD